MKKVSVKKGAACMACLECVRACSQAFYKEFHQDKACIQVVEKNGGSEASDLHPVRQVRQSL